MKKLLLLWMVAMLAAINLYAEEEGGMGKWMKSFQPVADGKDMGTVRMAQGGEGSVYVSSTYDKAFTFGQTSVAEPEISGSSAIVKYDGDGDEQWAVLLLGAATVTAMTADADGTLYAAGTFMDEVTLTGADSGTKSIANDGSTYSAFVLKVAPDGKISGAKTLTSAVNEWVASQVGDPWGEGFDSPLYMAFDPIDITPVGICLNGGKVYVGASYAGDVAELGWQGSYADQWGMMYSDNTSTGVFSLDKSDLEGAASVMNVQMTGVIAEGNYMAKGFGFTVYGGVLYAGFFNDGELTVTAKDKTENLSADYGKQQYVLVTVGSDLSVKTFESSKGDKSGGQYKSELSVSEDDLIIGGHFYGELPFDPTKTSGEASNDGGEIKYAFWNSAFVASLKKTDGQVNWTQVMPMDSKSVCMLVTGDEIHAATNKGLAEIETANGDVEFDSEMMVDAAAGYKDDYASIVMIDGATVNVITMNMSHDDEHGGNSDGSLPGFWQKSFEPIPEGQESDLAGVHIAAALDGSVYASTTYNKTIKVAGKVIPETGGMVSSLIVKYDKKGDEQWGVALVGAATVTAMTADIDGTLYAAGTFMDEVTLTGADGGTRSIANDGSTYSAFVLKVAPDGKISGAKTLTSAVNEWVASQVGDPWGEGFDSPLYMAFDPIDITPVGICLNGGKVYVGASYAGDVAELGWQGSYADQWGMMYSDNTSIGVFSLNKSDLEGAASVMNVQMTGVIAEGNYMAKGFGFTVDGGVLYAGFFNDGELTVTAKDKTENLSVDYGKQQYVLVTVGSDLSVKTFESSKGDKSGGQYKSSLNVYGDDLIIGGHFYGELPFDPTKTSGEVSNDGGEIKYAYWNTAYIASLKKADGTVNWTVVNPAETATKGISFLVYDKGVLASTSVGTSLFMINGNPVDGIFFNMSFDEFANYLEANASYVYTQGNRVFVGGSFDAEEAEMILTGIEQPKTEVVKVQGQLYNLMGQPVDANYKGLVITSDGKKFFAK